MTIEEVIQQAYDNIKEKHLFEPYKSSLDEWGFFKIYDTRKIDRYYSGAWEIKGYNPTRTGPGSHLQTIFIRPRSLYGIEQNNSWTKYVDENTWPQSKDLLYDVCTYHKESDVSSEPLKVHRRLTAIEVINLCNEGIITHWREHKEELKPKY